VIEAAVSRLVGPAYCAREGGLGGTRPARSAFAGHLAPMSGTGPDEFHGRQPLNDWISGIHALLPDLSFVLDVGPIADEQYLVVQWRARGTYAGGFPGAVGREVTFTGTDILRVADGMIAEYWRDADSLLFIQQLGVREVPAYTPQG
jgi:hypothetical protein